MKVSLSWLKELVGYSLSPQELANKLSLHSIGVKSITDDYIELDLTYNRGDLLSLRGVAREAAAITGSKPKFEDKPFPKYDLPETAVKIENNKLCPIYCVAKIQNLKVEKSNDTWVKKLSDSGIRSVNSIADVTNLIMLEYGQPMHAFDARGVADESIIVRLARKDERITTLDGKTRDLGTSDLMIADSLNALGIAGVMGGKDSEVTDSTTTILLEAAIFDPVSIRDTSKRHGLYSEASKRFQHGLTKTNLLQALSVAIKMYEGLGGKLIAISLVGDLEDKVKTIQLTKVKINSLLGLDIPAQEIEQSLKSLGFILASNPGGWNVTVPYFRLDVGIEEDLIEEVARMYGYEKIEGKKLEGQVPKPLDQSLQNFIHDLKVKLAGVGLTEVQTYSFYSTDILKVLYTWNVSSKLVKVANPISSETQYLRDKLWPNLIEVVGRNLKQGFKDIAIFEIGKVYSPKKGELPNEKYHLAIALMNWSDNPLADLSAIAKSVNLGGGSARQPRENMELFHPTRITENMAEVHPRVLNKFGIEKRVAILEIDLEALL